MKTFESVPSIQSMTYAAPMKREEALSEGDWERAYTLACREEGVHYLTDLNSETLTTKPRKKSGD